MTLHEKCFPAGGGWPGWGRTLVCLSGLRAVIRFLSVGMVAQRGQFAHVMPTEAAGDVCRWRSVYAGEPRLEICAGAAMNASILARLRCCRGLSVTRRESLARWLHARGCVSLFVVPPGLGLWVPRYGRCYLLRGRVLCGGCLVGVESGFRAPLLARVRRIHAAAAEGATVIWLALPLWQRLFCRWGKAQQQEGRRPRCSQRSCAVLRVYASTVRPSAHVRSECMVSARSTEIG